MDEQELKHAERHIRNAWIVGIIITAVTLIFSAIGAYSQTIRFKTGFDTWTLLDVAIIAALTFGIFKKNRFCALSLLIYYVVGKVSAAAYGGQFGHGIGVLIFGYFLFRGTIAAFQIHRHLIETNQKSKKTRGAFFYIGIGFISTITVVLVPLIIFLGLGPPTEVVPGKMLNKKYSSFIREQGLIEHGEEIIYWYSDGFPGFKNGFYFYTSDKVIVYCKDWDDPVISIPFSMIEDIRFEHNPSFFIDSMIILTLYDDTEVHFPVSSEKGGDKNFYNTLIEMWEIKRQTPPDKV